MKKQLLTLAVLFTIAASTAFGQCTTEEKDSNKFLVAGECGMCETRIEVAAKEVEGVTGAEWDKETKMLALAFNCANPDVKSVHKAVAAVGHDTKLVKAEDAVYDKLPECCKYERLAKKE